MSVKCPQKNGTKHYMLPVRASSYARALPRALRCPDPRWLQHSPSFRAQSESCGEMLHLDRRQGLGERVCDHVVGWAINKSEGALLDHPADEVVPHVDVLGTCVVLMVPGEGDC